MIFCHHSNSLNYVNLGENNIVAIVTIGLTSCSIVVGDNQFFRNPQWETTNFHEFCKLREGFCGLLRLIL